MVKNLEKLVAERKQQAEDKQIEYKAMTIARYLGEGGESKSYERGIRGESGNWVYSSKSYQITNNFSSAVSNDGGGSIGIRTLVEYKGKLVFEGSGDDIKAYVPGAWERYFNTLYNKAEKIKKKEESKKEADKKRAAREKKSSEKKLKKNFGL